MTHTAGIPGGNGSPGDQRSEVRNLSGLETSSPPGDFFHYLDVGIEMLALVAEEVLGMRYEDALRTRILRPIGMSLATISASSEIRGRLATGYVPLHDDRPIAHDCPLAPAPWIEFNSSAGAISATAGDMTKYLRLIMNRGVCSRRRIVSENGIDLMIRRHTSVDKESSWPLGWYGYGLNVGEMNGHLMVGHSGGTGCGFSANTLVDMTNSFGTVVLTNGRLGIPWEPSNFIIRTLNAQSEGADLPPVPPRQDPLRTENPSDYVGLFKKPGKNLIFYAKGKHLFLKKGKVSTVLEPCGKDAFLAKGSEYGLCQLVFGRKKGRVVDLCHGSDLYTNKDYTGPSGFDYPADWEAYTGHYRSFNPWCSNFRIVLRKGNCCSSCPCGTRRNPSYNFPMAVSESKRTKDSLSASALIASSTARPRECGILAKRSTGLSHPSI